MSISEAEPMMGKLKGIEGDSLSERVRLYVLEQSGNLAAIHRITGVAKTTLGAWLKGEKGLTTPVFDRICQAYGIVPTRPDIGLGHSDHVPHVRNFITKSASIADYEEEIIRLRYREIELVREKSEMCSILGDLSRLAAAYMDILEPGTAAAIDSDAKAIAAKSKLLARKKAVTGGGDEVEK